jgi:hypothetical protein
VKLKDQTLESVLTEVDRLLKGYDAAWENVLPEKREAYLRESLESDAAETDDPWPVEMLDLLSAAPRLLSLLVEGIRQQQEAGAPPLWRHAIDECNAAHVLLDKLGAPKTKSVPNRELTGRQDITLGLVERIRSLPAPPHVSQEPQP